MRSPGSTSSGCPSRPPSPRRPCAGSASTPSSSSPARAATWPVALWSPRGIPPPSRRGACATSGLASGESGAAGCSSLERAPTYRRPPPIASLALRDRQPRPGGLRRPDREEAHFGREEEGPVPVHPQLREEPDGGGPAPAPGRRPLRSHERRDGGHPRKASGDPGDGGDRRRHLGAGIQDPGALFAGALRLRDHGLRRRQRGVSVLPRGPVQAALVLQGPLEGRGYGGGAPGGLPFREGPYRGPDAGGAVERRRIAMRKQKVLFLCTQNSARSQMAERMLRHLAGDRFEVMSAGIGPTAEINPCAVEAMSEVGIDISEQYPKGLKTYLGFPKAATEGRTHSPAPEALT